eukprot:scaffold19129_cov55-Cyclotella_meneghiniana.AAC.1
MHDASMPRNVFNYTEASPFRRIDATIPTDNTGFVYCITSVPRPEKIYIGQTQNLSQRLPSHNNGTGAFGSQDPRDRPWAIGSYICGLSHMNKTERESLEDNWKQRIRIMIEREGINNPYAWILAGAHVVESHNEGCNDESEHIRRIEDYFPHQRGLGQMSPNGSRPVSGVGEFEGGRVPSCNGIAGETANFDDFHDVRSKPKWPKSSEQHPHQRVSSKVMRSKSA